MSFNDSEFHFIIPNYLFQISAGPCIVLLIDVEHFMQPAAFWSCICSRLHDYCMEQGCFYIHIL